MRHHFLTTFLVCILLPIPGYARLRSPAGFEDIQDMARHATLIFRGEVVDFKPAATATHAKEGLAVIAVDRWYRGSSSSRYVKLHFAYDDWVIDGHDCKDLEIGTDWIVFAEQGTNQALEMVDDCDGALRISALLGADTTDGLFSQIEEDFAAGLDDSDADLRMASILRLAALGQLRSTEALHRIVVTGSEEESNRRQHRSTTCCTSTFESAL